MHTFRENRCRTGPKSSRMCKKKITFWSENFKIPKIDLEPFWDYWRWQKWKQQPQISLGRTCQPCSQTLTWPPLAGLARRGGQRSGRRCPPLRARPARGGQVRVWDNGWQVSPRLIWGCWFHFCHLQSSLMKSSSIFQKILKKWSFFTYTATFWVLLTHYFSISMLYTT